MVHFYSIKNSCWCRSFFICKQSASILTITRRECFVVLVYLNYKTVIPSLRGISHNSTLWDPSFLRMTRRECFVVLGFLQQCVFMLCGVIPSLRVIPHNSTLWDPSFLRMTRGECFVLLVYLNCKTVIPSNVIPSLRGISNSISTSTLNAMRSFIPPDDMRGVVWCMGISKL